MEHQTTKAVAQDKLFFETNQQTGVTRITLLSLPSLAWFNFFCLFLIRTFFKIYIEFVTILFIFGFFAHVAYGTLDPQLEIKPASHPHPPSSPHWNVKS